MDALVQKWQVTNCKVRVAYLRQSECTKPWTGCGHGIARKCAIYALLRTFFHPVCVYNVYYVRQPRVENEHYSVRTKMEFSTNLVAVGPG